MEEYNQYYNVLSQEGFIKISEPQTINFYF